MVREREQSIQTALPALFAVTDSKSETSVSNRLSDHSDHPDLHMPQQLADKATVPDSLICRCQFDKYNTGFHFGLKRILDILSQQKVIQV